MMPISSFQDSKDCVSQDRDLYYLRDWQYFLHKRVILFPILGICTPNRLYKPLSERINTKCKCDWVRSEIREKPFITSGQWGSRVECLGRYTWFGGTNQARVQPNVLKDWVAGCVNGPLSTQERCDFTTKASNSKDSIFKSLCTDLECFLLKQISVFKLLPTLSLLELRRLNVIYWWDAM